MVRNVSFAIEVPPDVDPKHVDDPTGKGDGYDVYTWQDPDGTTYWVCTNGNEVVTPPPNEPPDVPPSNELPTFEPPTYEPPPPYNSPTPTYTPTPSPVPTASPTPTVVLSPTPTNTPTPFPTPSAPPTPTPTRIPTPTATPTPSPSPTPFPFDNSMCQCDDIKKPLDPIVIGNPFTVTAYGKVMGINKNYAKIPTFTFTFYKGSGTVVELVKPAEKVNTTIIEETADKTRYQAVWTLDLSGIDKSQTYRIQAHPDCSRKAAASYFTSNSVVLGASTKALSLWDRIASFFVGLFGGSSNKDVTNQVSVSTPAPTLTSQQKKNLQFQTCTPANNVDTGQDANNCTFIKFSF